MSKACPKYKDAVASVSEKGVQTVNSGSRETNLIAPTPGSSHIKSYGEMGSLT